MLQKPIRALHVYKFYGPVRGGGIAAMESVIEGLNSSTESTALVAAEKFGWGRVERIKNARVRRVFSFGCLYSTPIAPTIPIWFANEIRHADIVHIHLPFPIADLAVNLWRPRTPIVLHWHSDIVQQSKMKRYLKPMLRGTLKLADRIIVGSPRCLDSSEELQPFRDKCEIIPYSVNSNSWSELAPGEVAKILELKARHPRMLLFVGRLVAYKGLPVLIRAMRDLDAELVVAGQGPMLPQLERLAKELGIHNKIHFVGEISNEQLKTYYHACYVFVLPSIWRNETFGIVQLEAMACQKPIVNTNLETGVPWVARHEREGITVPPNDVQALSNAIQYLIENPAKAAAYGRAGADRVHKVFDREKMSEQVHLLYTQLLEQKPGSLVFQGERK
ncbi:glycosyltransferase [Pseudomonadota bacterium]